VVYNSRFNVSSGGLISYGPISSINSGGSDIPLDLICIAQIERPHLHA